ncbi:MAG TPA: endonuclease domain-containing protein [Polyangiaceae bacterium]|nr:endonuclease domain-containing protein [Polyangiaceae bacterium]
MLPGGAPPLSRCLARARLMRRQPTPSEALLWGALRRNRLGVHFRRQHVVGAFIVDFACLARRLVVEVDGGVHREPDVAFADGRRQTALEALGLRVLRVTAEQVERDLPAVLARVRGALKAQ